MKHTTLFRMQTTFAGILLCSLVFLSLNCIEKPLSPVLASSEISLGSIPLVDVTTYFSAYEQKSASNFLVVDSTIGMYNYVNKQSTAKQNITLPTMTATDTSMQVAVGTFSVGSISPSPTSISVSDIGLTSGYPVPATPFTLASQSIGDTSTLRYVQLSDMASNVLSLTITNNLPVSMAFKPILLRNNWTSPLDTSWVANFIIPDTLSTGESKTYTTSVATKKMWGLLKTDSIKIYTPGSGLTTVTFAPGAGIAISLSSGPLTADSAAAFIPSLTVYNKNNADWVIDDSTILSSAAFDAGEFHLKFVNNLGVNVGVNLTVNELINTSTGKSYSIDTTLTSQTTTILPRIEMSQYYVSGGAAASGTFGTKLTYSGIVKTLTSADNSKRLVRNSDYITAEIVPDAPFVLKSLTGRIRTTVVKIDQRFASNIDVNELKGFSGSIALDSIYLLASLPLGGNDGCTADYVITITEKNTKHNRIDTLVISSYAGYKRIIPGVATQIPVLSVDHPAFFNSLMRFFPDVPDSFFVQGYMVIDPNFALSTAANSSMHDTSAVYPSFDIDLPVRFQIGSSSYTQTMAFDSSQIPVDFTKNIGQGSVVFTVVNNMPLQMSMKTAFLHFNPATNKCDTLFWLPKTDTVTNRVDSMYILPAPISSAGWANGTTKSTSTISLNTSDMANFNKTDSIYIRLYNLQSTNGQTVRVLGTNYIRIVGVGNITYTIKSN